MTAPTVTREMIERVFGFGAARDPDCLAIRDFALAALSERARPLAEEVLRLRKLLADINERGIKHNVQCEGGWKGKPCPCGADALQERINEEVR